MNRNTLFSIGVVLIIGIFIGCGEKEDKDILDARLAAAEGDFSAVQMAVERALANNPKQPEALSLQNILRLRSSSDVSAWQSGLEQVLSHLKPLNEQIQVISDQEDPDSDDLDRQERLIRSRNSIASSLVNSLAEAKGKQNNLITDLAKQPKPIVITALLEAEKCFQLGPRETAARLIQEATTTSDAARKLLVQATRHADPRIRREAIKHLGNMRSEELIPTFESVLKNKDEEPDVLYRVVVALEMLIGKSAVLPALSEATKTNTTQVRIHAAKLIGQLKAEEGIDEMIRLLADSNSYVTNTAANALVEIGDASISPLIEVLDTDARNVIPSGDSEFMHEYQYIANVFIDDARLQKRRSSTQSHVIGVLGALRSREAVPRLINLLADDDLRVSALDALVAMGTAATPHLYPALEHNAEKIRISIAEALSKIQDRRTIKPLIAALERDGQRKEVKSHAAEALGSMRARGTHDGAVSALSSALGLDETTATNAAVALGQINVATDETIRGLITMAMDKQRRETVRTTAISSLGLLKPTAAVQPLILLMLSDDTSPVIRNGAVAALGEIKSNESLAPLLWILSTRYDDVKDFQRHMKRRYNTLDEFRSAIEALEIQWTSDYPQPMYRTWGELKSIPSLVRSEAAIALGKIRGKFLFSSTQRAQYEASLNGGDVPEGFRQEFASNGTALSQNITLDVDRPGEIWILTDKANQTRYDCRKVGEALNIYLRGDDVLDTLISALKDDERATVRRSAAFALGEIKGESTISHLLSAVKDEQGVVRQEVATALGKIKGDRVVAPLLSVLKKDKFESTRKQAAIALRELDPVQADVDLIDVIQKGVGTFEEDHEVLSVMNEVVASLTKGGGAPTAKYIQDALKSADDEWTRSTLLKTLASLEHFASVKGLADVFKSELQHSSYIVRKTAIGALGKYKDRDSVDVLIKVLQDENEYKSMRAEAAAALGALLDERASAPLLAALDNENAEVRAKAATALGAIKDANAVGKLIALVEDRLEATAVRAASIAALGAIEDKSVEPQLLNILQTESGELYNSAISALGKLKSTKAVPELIAILEDRSLPLDASTDALAKASSRTKAAAALADIGDERAAEVLGRRVADETEYIVAIHEGLKRNWSWEAFIAAAKPFQLPAFAAPKLEQRMEDTWEDAPIRTAASLALVHTDVAQDASEVAARLRGLLSSPQSAVRQATALAIGKSKIRELKDELLKMMKGVTELNKDVRRGATQGVGELADITTVPDLIEVFNDETNHEEIRRDAAISLGKLGTSEAVSALIETLQTLQTNNSSKAFRIDITKALGNAKNAKAVAILETVLKDRDSDIHFHAAEALFQISGEGYGYNRVG
ncbi:MAG: HEAT repeat domain-containing protein [Candidatus Poribacteria bacterium]|nr:HEAT repeat domain-containing protein [Candidatus Poribacteria bacterium]MDE0504582.1 HEAT repeat domain-containing protein [Candidatus Poribacteria bacterium]